MQLRSLRAASVVISDLYIERFSFLPDKTGPPSVVDPNAVLSCPVFLKGFEMVTAIDRQHPEVSRRIQHQKLTASRPLDRLKADYGLIVEDGFGLRVLERSYRQYADRMTRCAKCRASCSIQKNRCGRFRAGPGAQPFGFRRRAGWPEVPTALEWLVVTLFTGG